MLACIAFDALLFPGDEVEFMGMRMSSGNALVAALGLNAMGIVMGWGGMDYWAHLGGAAFGIVVFLYFLYKMFRGLCVRRRPVQADSMGE